MTLKLNFDPKAMLNDTANTTEQASRSGGGIVLPKDGMTYFYPVIPLDADSNPLPYVYTVTQDYNGKPSAATFLWAVVVGATDSASLPANSHTQVLPLRLTAKVATEVFRLLGDSMADNNTMFCLDDGTIVIPTEDDGSPMTPTRFELNRYKDGDYTKYALTAQPKAWAKNDSKLVPDVLEVPDTSLEDIVTNFITPRDDNNTNAPSPF